ncbi:MAG: LysM peptidoglycan-binding domain-containing protein [Anaerolineaceae bacterium]|nr:MAG: LysM peptidoglycan-binding domain-containing protein [Anaerolineaceae bacterium]
MSADTADALQNHPRYQMALHHLQKGEWKAGISHVDHLMVQFPLVPELRALRQDFLLKAKLDRDERTDLAIEKAIRFRKYVTRIITVSLLAVIGFWGIHTYSSWLGDKLDLARQKVEHEILTAQLYAKSSEAQALLRVGRVGEAKILLEEIASINPDFPGLKENMAQVDVASSLERLYIEAMDLIAQEDWMNAKTILENLAALDPTFRDVEYQLNYIEKVTLLNDIFAQAEADFLSEAWVAAVSGFEGVRALHPEFRPEIVEERLYLSYVNAARETLIDQPDSLMALEIAEGYFRKALTLRPQDSEIKAERELARLYLTAQDDFSKGRWSEVIDSLEAVYAIDPEYALGTTRQTLYDAYVARGESEVADGEYDTALSDFQRSIALADQDPDAVLRLYEAQIRTAEVLGILGNYEVAVVHYRVATEIGGLKRRNPRDNPSLIALLQDAEYYTNQGNYGLAFERYHQAVEFADTTQTTVTHVVQEGEYLTMLASRYDSTVRAIALANGITNANLIYVGQELIIPILP